MKFFFNFAKNVYDIHVEIVTVNRYNLTFYSLTTYIYVVPQR